MNNYKSITLKRTDDRIDFLNWRGNVIAFLHDDQNQIAFDPFANSGHLFVPEIEPLIDYPQVCKEQGLDVLTARMIDAMPDQTA